jgi:hypothetical protein
VKAVAHVKRVPDPEAPASLSRIDATGQRAMEARSAPLLTTTHGESALGAALQRPEGRGGTFTLLGIVGDFPRVVAALSAACRALRQG